MTHDEQETIIKRYIEAYNAFDVEAMIALVHPDVVFKNISGGEISAEAVGIGQLKQMAVQSKGLFSSRHQNPTKFEFRDDIAVVEIAYKGIPAVDLPIGVKAGEILRLEGRSEFEFKDGKIFRITDIS